MTYNELINNMLTYYSGYGFIKNVGKGQEIGKPLFQYKETDWNFLKRIGVRKIFVGKNKGRHSK